MYDYQAPAGPNGTESVHDGPTRPPRGIMGVPDIDIYPFTFFWKILPYTLLNSPNCL
jgi:hypothetical protein